MRNRFKGLDLIRVYEELQIEVCNTVQMVVTKVLPKKKKCNKANGWIIEKAREFQKNIYFYFIEYAKAFDGMYHKKCGKLLNRQSIRPPYLPSEKPICQSRSNSWNQTWNNGLVENWKRSTMKLYIVILLI